MKLRKTAVSIVILVSLLLLIFVVRHDRDDETMVVPIGVENAVAITYGGPRLEVTPFKRGVSVNVRIALVRETNGTRVYDVRYILNDSGTYNISDFLQSVSDEPIDDLPEFIVEGSSDGVINIEDRIQESETVTVQIKHHYFEKLFILFILWIIWLLMLIFYKRPHKHKELLTVEPAQTFAETLAPYINRLRDGGLDTKAKSELEDIMFGFWSSKSDVNSSDMFHTLLAIEKSSEFGCDYDMLENWIHNSQAQISDTLIAEMLAGCCADNTVEKGGMV